MSIAALENSLKQAHCRPIGHQGDVVLGSPHLMKEVIQSLQGKGRGNLLKHNPQQKKYTCEAVRTVRENRTEELPVRKWRHIAGGLTHSCEECSAPPLIQGNVELFFTLLKALEVFHKKGELRPSACKKLLYSYLVANPETIKNNLQAKENWLAMRASLTKHLDLLLEGKNPIPRWAKILNEHRNLLTDKPCEPYIESTLLGDMTAVNELGEQLRIPEESWFWQDLWKAQLDAITSYPDSQFKEAIPSILKLISSRPALIDQGLVALLTRYKRCTDHSVHDELCEFTIHRWGTPNLERQVLWNLVEQPVKNMVRQWIISQDLRDFFELLQDDRQVDKRRLHFWSDYIDQIDNHIILLGQQAWNDRRADFVKLRKEKSDRIGRLTGVAEAENNAFVMKIGRHIFIEFSRTGNACYAYHQEKVPGIFLEKTYAIHEVKARDIRIAGFNGIHRDTNIEKWERKFARGIKNMLSSAPITEETTSFDSDGQFNEGLFWEYAKRKKLAVRDNRGKGGTLKVHPDLNLTHDVIHRLEAWGFKKSQAGDYWRK